MNVGNQFAVGAWAEGIVDGADGITRMQGVTLDLSALKADFAVGGYFVVECWDSEGNLRWETTAENGVTNVGLNHLLNTEWAAGVQSTVWFLGMIDNTGSPVLSPSDTMAVHSGWSEIPASATSDTTRVQWSPATATAQSLVNGTSSDYHIIASSPITVFGLFLCDNSIKGTGTTGCLSSTAPFSTGPQVCKSGDTLRSTYTMGGASN